MVDGCATRRRQGFEHGMRHGGVWKPCAASGGLHRPSSKQWGLCGKDGGGRQRQTANVESEAAVAAAVRRSEDQSGCNAPATPCGANCKKHAEGTRKRARTISEAWRVLAAEAVCVCARALAHFYIHARCIQCTCCSFCKQHGMRLAKREHLHSFFWCIRSLEELRNNLVLSRASDNDVTDLSVRFHMILLNDKKSLTTSPPVRSRCDLSESGANAVVTEHGDYFSYKTSQKIGTLCFFSYGC